MKKILTTLIDDLDGGDAEETVVFGIDGQVYEIDLNEEHAEQIRTDLDKWVARSRIVKRGQRPLRKHRVA